MTPDVANYADYYLRRLVNSLEKPYDPDGGGESGLARLTNHLVGDKAVLDPATLEKLRDAKLNDAQLAKLVLALADDIVAAPKFADQNLDINIVRALLYLQRSDPRIDQRVRQYLYGRQLTDLSHEAVAALDPNTGEGRAFEIIELLGRLMWTVDRAALVFCIDQVEDLRFFDDPQERFQKAVRDLIQIANRVPTSIVLVSCLGDFYDKVREVLAQSYIDRIEKAGPVRLERDAHGRGGAAHHRQAAAAGRRNGGIADPTPLFRPAVLRGVQRPVDAAHPRAGADAHARAGGRTAEPAEPEEKARLHLDAGRGARLRRRAGRRRGGGRRPQIDFRELWERFTAQSEAEIPSDDQGLLDVLAGALALAREEWGGAIDLTVKRLDDRRGPAGRRSHLAARDGLCRRGPHLPVQPADPGRRPQAPARPGAAGHDGQELLHAAGERLPAQQEEPDRAGLPQVPRERRPLLLVPITDWERMMMVREFHAQHRHDPGFADWFERAKLLSEIPALVQLLRLDLFRRKAPTARRTPTGRRAASTAPVPHARLDRAAGRPAAAQEKELPLSVLLDEAGDGADQHPGRPRAALQQEHHAQQGRAEAPHRRARRLGLGQDHAGAVHHRAAAAAGARRRC